MKIPVLRGVIARRLLINYRVDPDCLQALLPPPFEPQLVNGMGLAGICLIRLTQMRPQHLPGFVGVTSENAAHRIAVRWHEDGKERVGVYIPRRDTASRFNTWVGGRLVPGYHHHADFTVQEHQNDFHIVVDSGDRQTHVAVDAQLVTDLSAGSVFGTLAAASRFFEQGSVGYSPMLHSDELQGLQLQSYTWQVEPLAVSRVESSFFADPQRFPPGSCTFDCALLMRHIEHEWHEQPSLGKAA